MLHLVVLMIKGATLGLDTVFYLQDFKGSGIALEEAMWNYKHKHMQICLKPWEATERQKYHLLYYSLDILYSQCLHL